MIATQDLGKIAGKHVVGPDNESIGKIKDVYESTDGGGGTFATVTTGLFGSGSSFFPLEAADLRGDDIVVPFGKDFVKDAPRVENDEELTGPEEEKLFAYYGQQGADAGMVQTGTDTRERADVSEERDTVGHDTSGPTTDTAMTRSEEKLQVGTQSTEAGRARLRKYVVTEQETVTVPVSHEEVRLEREPITDANRGDAMDGPAISEEEHEVVLKAERPVVATEAVPVERVTLNKETVTDQETVTGEVRKEQVEVEGDVDRT